MSLDVYLYDPDCGGSIVGEEPHSFFDANITHNLNIMAEAAGIYYALWRPEEIGVFNAHQLIPLLEEGLAKLKADPKKYEAYNSPNGWGLYENFVPWIEKYLAACKECPMAIIKASR